MQDFTQGRIMGQVALAVSWPGVDPVSVGYAIMIPEPDFVGSKPFLGPDHCFYADTLNAR